MASVAFSQSPSLAPVSTFIVRGFFSKPYPSDHRMPEAPVVGQSFRCGYLANCFLSRTIPFLSNINRSSCNCLVNHGHHGYRGVKLLRSLRGRASECASCWSRGPGKSPQEHPLSRKTCPKDAPNERGREGEGRGRCSLLLALQG